MTDGAARPFPALEQVGVEQPSRQFTHRLLDRRHRRRGLSGGRRLQPHPRPGRRAQLCRSREVRHRPERPATRGARRDGATAPRCRSTAASTWPTRPCSAAWAGSVPRRSWSGVRRTGSVTLSWAGPAPTRSQGRRVPSGSGTAGRCRRPAVK